MSMNDEFRSKLNSIFKSQRIAVLGVSKDDDPYSCLVAFTVTKDLRHLIFATMRARKKYRYMKANPRVTLMVDDRKHEPNIYANTTSITIVGTAKDVEGKERSKFAGMLLDKHPALTDFVEDEDAAVMRVDIEDMYIVDNFESVKKISFKK